MSLPRNKDSDDLVGRAKSRVAQRHAVEAGGGGRMKSDRRLCNLVQRRPRPSDVWTPSVSMNKKEAWRSRRLMCPGFKSRKKGGVLPRFQL